MSGHEPQLTRGMFRWMEIPLPKNHKARKAEYDDNFWASNSDDDCSNMETGGETIHWPCLVFTGEAHLTKIWDKYDLMGVAAGAGNAKSTFSLNHQEQRRVKQNYATTLPVTLLLGQQCPCTTQHPRVFYDRKLPMHLSVVTEDGLRKFETRHRHVPGVSATAALVRSLLAAATTGGFVVGENQNQTRGKKRPRLTKWGSRLKQKKATPTLESEYDDEAESAATARLRYAHDPAAADRALQQLLQRACFQFKLHKHQHQAVRRVAGVPRTFPFHLGSLVESPETATMAQAVHGLVHCGSKEDTSVKGLCVADAMGLGKTVEAIGGAIIRNAVANAQQKKRLPILIVSPNDVVMMQWKETLLVNGVSERRIIMFRRGVNKGFDSNNFILLTRYTAQSELKDTFESLLPTSQGGNGVESTPTAQPSRLFPNISAHLLRCLKSEYQANKGSGRSGKTSSETRDDYISRLLAAYRDEAVASPTFRLAIIDEAHFLKNRLTYWTMSISLAALCSERVVPLTGTPFNNGVNDLGTLMTLIDPAEPAAYTYWWNQRVYGSGQNATELKASLHSWNGRFMLRRTKKMIADQLPQKNVFQTKVQMMTHELAVYESYEARVTEVLEEFANELHDGSDRYRLKNIFRALMAVLSLMRMSVLHPLLPASGREVTKLFSPSRNSALSKRECPEKCVCCDQALRPSIPLDSGCRNMAATAQHMLDMFKHPSGADIGTNTANPPSDIEDKMEEGETYNDDQEEVYQSDGRPVFPLSAAVCGACSPVVHYAHADCAKHLAALQRTSGDKVTCPRCLDIETRVRGSASSTYWCRNIVEKYPDGFAGSPKLNAVIDWILAVDQEEKILILSFFKGSLDLVEAILVHELQMPCARFDGDVNTKTKTKELHRFKTDPDCRVLLMTVQSGGCGLNLCEANHVGFLDRWYNPFIHEQAEDRCHRIGQTKTVEIRYFDAAGTFDEAMCEINKVKQQNSEILLADGLQLGSGGGSVTYTELSGLISRLIAAIRKHRRQFSSHDGSAVIPPVSEEAMQSCIPNQQHKSRYGNHMSSSNPGNLDEASALSSLQSQSSAVPNPITSTTPNRYAITPGSAVSSSPIMSLRTTTTTSTQSAVPSCAVVSSTFAAMAATQSSSLHSSQTSSLQFPSPHVVPSLPPTVPLMPPQACFSAADNNNKNAEDLSDKTGYPCASGADAPLPTPDAMPSSASGDWTGLTATTNNTATDIPSNHSALPSPQPAPSCAT